MSEEGQEASSGDCSVSAANSLEGLGHILYNELKCSMLAGDKKRSDLVCCYGYYGCLGNKHFKVEEDRHVLTSLIS